MKVIRNMVTIDEEKCNGCGLCVTTCHEGALQLIDGKAKLVSESYCDGLGDCLPACPMDAITIEKREATPYDEEAVLKKAESESACALGALPSGCPGTQTKTMSKNMGGAKSVGADTESQLAQWPCQIKLIPVNAPFFNNAHLLVAADCTAYANANIHQNYMRNKITIIGCPKLDSVDYSEKFTAILKAHNIKSITVLRMSVPCCGGIVNAVKNSLIASGKMIPWRIVTIDTDGTVLED